MSATTSGQGLLSGRWSVDLRTTSATFRVRDVLHRPVVGRLPVTAAHVDVERGQVVAVVAELDLAHVDTGHGRRDRDLRGSRFFDVASSPRLLFRGGPAVVRPEGGWLLRGTLELRGTSCPVELVVVRTDGGGTYRVRATATVDRRRVGITVPRLLVGSAVAITVEADLMPPELPADAESSRS